MYADHMYIVHSKASPLSCCAPNGSTSVTAQARRQHALNVISDTKRPVLEGTVPVGEAIWLRRGDGMRS